MKDLLKDVYTKVMELSELVYEQTGQQISVVIEVPSPVWYALCQQLPESRSRRDHQSIDIDDNVTIVKAQRDETLRATREGLQSAKIMLQQIGQTVADALEMRLVPKGRDRW